jgi:tRNA-Thr(GGU) m(6)t(6)A37 methyltransferase TsaA
LSIEIEPIGHVISEYAEPDIMPIHGRTAIIEIDPKYQDGLKMIEYNSHLWVMSWFHKANRQKLTTTPCRIDPNLPEFGVFALRTPPRPNPIALSLVELVRVEGNKLYVNKYDAIDGTPVLDIKPYFQKDIVFSPKTPDIRPATLERKREWIKEEAMRHHQELCHALVIGVRMAAIAEMTLGKLCHDDVILHVQGSACLFDTLQGVSRGRFANPPRVSFQEATANSDGSVQWISIWEKGDKKLTVTCNSTELLKMDIDTLEACADEEIFQVILNS